MATSGLEVRAVFRVLSVETGVFGSGRGMNIASTLPAAPPYVLECRDRQCASDAP
jgi:hypothetical protein